MFFKKNLFQILIIYSLFKIISVSIMFNVMPNIFEQSVFKLPDFQYYSSGDLGPGPNIGFRWLVWSLDINSLEDYLPITLSIILNLIIDIAWLIFFSKFLKPKTLILIIILIGFHPYAATYFLKFSSDIFMKLGLLIVVLSIFSTKVTDKNLKKNSNVKIFFEWFMWLSLISLRNANAFIAIPYFFLKNRFNIIKSTLFTISLLIYLLYVSKGYMDGLKPINRPWDFNYLERVFDIQNHFFLIIVSLFSRILMLFGAREKIYVEGIEPFLNSEGEISIELYGYIFMGLVQFIGFLNGICFLFRQSKSKMIFIITIPLFLSILTVSHQRYLLPFIPICCFGLVKLIEKKIYKNIE